MKTYEERLASIYVIAKGELATFPEKLKIIYNWWMFEQNLILRDNAIKRADKHGARLHKEFEVLKLRYDMQDL